MFGSFGDPGEFTVPGLAVTGLAGSRVSLTPLGVNPTSPGNGLGTLTGVVYNASNNTYVASFGGALANVSVPLLVANAGPQLAAVGGPR